MHTYNLLNLLLREQGGKMYFTTIYISSDQSLTSQDEYIL